MGCGSSAPVEPEDPMVQLRIDLQNGRLTLQSSMTYLSASESRVRYYLTMMQKCNMCINELTGNHACEVDLYI